MKQKGITGSTLKIIAVVTMIIDHIGASVLWMLLKERRILYAVSGLDTIFSLTGSDRTLALLWWGMRIVVGRIAFPVFCFLLVEGFLHTKNAAKYTGRLFLFALISEIPFDLMLFENVYAPDYQNVFFTLLAGFLCMQGMSLVDRKSVENGRFHSFFSVFLKILIVVLGMSAGYFLKTDYGASGVAFILLLYFFRGQKKRQIAAGCVGSILLLEEWAAPLAFLFIAFYKGKRGLKLKYLFYVIYPLHLFLLYLICVFLKTA